MTRAQTDPGAIISVVISAIVVLIGLLLFDVFGQMGPQSGPLGDANQSLIDAGAILPLAVGMLVMAIIVVGMLSILRE